MRDETELFQAADSNGDGFVDRSEISGLAAPATNEKVLNVTTKQSMEDADSDGNGKLSLVEFESSYSRLADPQFERTFQSEDANDDDYSSAEPGKLFSKLDRNADGSIDLNELRALESGRIEVEKRVDSFMSSIDVDGNNHINSAELTNGRHAVLDGDLKEYLVAWAKRRKIGFH